jgi:hypothetical protein
MLIRNLQITRYRLLFLITAIALTLLVFSVYLMRPGIDANVRARFPDMVYGTAHKPYVYRTLLPTTVRLMTLAIPSDWRSAIEHSLWNTSLIQSLFTRLKWHPDYLIEYLIGMVLMYLSIWGFVIALRYLFNGVFQAPVKFLDALTIAALLGLPFFFKYTNYCYDLPHLFIFTLCLGLMAHARWRSFLILFPIACLSKETAILLTVVFAIHFSNPRRLERKKFIWFLAYQLAVFVMIKLGLSLVFMHNRGELVEYHFLDRHNRKMLNQALGNLTPRKFHRRLVVVLAVLGAVWLMFYKWSMKPKFLKDSIWIFIPLFLLTTFLGWWNEWRDYYEFYPILLLLVAHSVAYLLRIPVVAIDRMHLNDDLRLYSDRPSPG